MLTRAQSLLIIFGDPETLIKDPNWEYLLQVCEINKTFKHIEGKPFKFPRPIVEAKLIAERYPILEPIQENMENETETNTIIDK